jgi:hypothetical protein
VEMSTGRSVLNGGVPMNLIGSSCTRVDVHRRLRRFVSRLLCSLALAAVSSTASANFTCDGKIQYLGLSPSGLVTVNVGFGTWYICDQTAPYGQNGITFSPEGCRSWFAVMLAAQKSGHGVRLFFNSSASTGNGPECTALGHWVLPNPSPYHMAVLDQ